jgi:hypothetical protein
MSKTTLSSSNREHENKGYYLQINDDYIPRIKKSDNGICGFAEETPGQMLFIFALEALYAFQCEDFETSNFNNTLKYTYAHDMKSHGHKNWFLSKEQKQLNMDSRAFYREFLQVLKKDITSYFGCMAKPLVSELMKELEFFEKKF